MKILKLLALVAFLSVLPACDKVGGGSTPDPEPEPEPEPQEDLGPQAPDAMSDIPDWTLLTASNHPRVIITDSDLKSIKEKVDAEDPILSVVHRKMIGLADSYLKKAALTYVITSNRLLNVSTAACDRIIACSYAYRYTLDDKYLTKAVEEIKAVCNFPDWHHTHFLDAGEMAMAVGFGYDWLYSKLDADTKALCEMKLNDYAFTKALNNTNSCAWFYSSTSNWNQVCNAGLSIAALATYEGSYKDNCKKIIEKAASSNLSVMQELYNPAGAYAEGYGYWGYGTGYECLMLSALESAANTDCGLASIEGFWDTGAWVMNMEGVDFRSFNFADCDSSIGPEMALWYLARKFKYPNILYGEIQKVKAGLYAGVSSSVYLPLALKYGASFENLSSIQHPGSVWYGDGVNPVYLYHKDWSYGDSDVFLAIKGGKAGHSHGHMDAGSFVYDAWGTRWSADLGLQSYGTLEGILSNFGTPSQQGSGRWTAFRYNNYNHSTLTINNCKFNVSGKANITGVANGTDEFGCTIDLTPVISKGSEGPATNKSSKLVVCCSSAIRTFTLKGDVLTISDAVVASSDTDASLKWTLITKAMPTVNDRYIELKGATKTLYLKADGDVRCTYKQYSTAGESYDASNTGFYEVGWEATVPKGERMVFETTLSPEK